MSYPYTNTSSSAATQTGLSTQILIQVDGVPVGAVQSMEVRQTRDVMRVTEIGTDGVIEIVPNKATQVSITVDRIYFDKKRMTEAFSRGFLNLHAQRLPFDITVQDFTNSDASNSPKELPSAIPDFSTAFDVADTPQGLVTHVYENCWFTNLTVRYQTQDYVITENASIECEFVHSFKDGNVRNNASSASPRFDDALERIADVGRRGSLDGRGLAKVQDAFAGLLGP